MKSGRKDGQRAVQLLKRPCMQDASNREVREGKGREGRVAIHPADKSCDKLSVAGHSSFKLVELTSKRVRCAYEW